MKQRLFIIIFLNFLFVQSSLGQKTWWFSAGLNNGLSFVNRQLGNNTLNNRKTTPVSPSYYNQLKLRFSKSFKSNKGFSAYTLSHCIYSYRTDIYDTRLSITNGGEPSLRKAIYSFNSFNFSYIYHRYLPTIKNIRLVAGVGVELMYYYRTSIRLDLQDGKQTIINMGRRINGNYFLNNIPTLILQFAGEFDLLGLSDVQIGLVYKKDLHYFIQSSIPLFSSFGLSLDVPFKIRRGQKE